MEGSRTLHHRQQLREALCGDFYCPWVWTEKKTSVGVGWASLEPEEPHTGVVHENLLESTGVPNPDVESKVKDDTFFTPKNSMEKISESILEEIDQEDQDVDNEDLPSLDEICEKVSQALSADSDLSNNDHDHESGSIEVFTTQKVDGSTNTSQPKLIDAITGNSQKLIDCGTGSSQPSMIDGAVQTSQSLLEDFIKEQSESGKAAMIFPRLALPTDAAIIPPKRACLDPSLDNWRMSHPIYSYKVSSPSSPSIAFEFDEGDKENNCSVSCYSEKAKENEGSFTAPPPLCLPLSNRSPFVRVGLSKKSTSACKRRYPLHQLSSKNS